MIRRGGELGVGQDREGLEISSEILSEAVPVQVPTMLELLWQEGGGCKKKVDLRKMRIGIITSTERQLFQ